MPKTYPDTEPIPDTPDNIAKAIMQGPPKDEWRFEKERRAEADDTKDSG